MKVEIIRSTLVAVSPAGTISLLLYTHSDSVVLSIEMQWVVKEREREKTDDAKLLGM